MLKTALRVIIIISVFAISVLELLRIYPDASCLLFVCYTYVLYAIHVGIVDHNIILFYDLRRHRSLVVFTAMQLHV